MRNPETFDWMLRWVPPADPPFGCCVARMVAGCCCACFKTAMFLLVCAQHSTDPCPRPNGRLACAARVPTAGCPGRCTEGRLRRRRVWSLVPPTGTSAAHPSPLPCSNPEYRQQLEGMLQQQVASSGSPAMAEMMQGMDMSSEKVGWGGVGWVTLAAAAAALLLLVSLRRCRRRRCRCACCRCRCACCRCRRCCCRGHTSFKRAYRLACAARSLLHRIPSLALVALQMQAQFDALGMSPDQFIGKVR